MTNKNFKIYAVGGQLRDELLGRKVHDRDYVVVGSTIEQMLSLGYKQVGKDFPVFLHPKTREEYALARKEVKTGDKHTDFKFEFGPDVTLEEDLRRRDFTVNSIAKDSETGELFDPFNGREDIYEKIIRHVDAEHFVEDPLRILRGIRFACQLRFQIHESTMELFKQMVKGGMLKHLTAERIWVEIEKALQTPNFYTFIMLLDEIGALEEIFPEIYSLKEVPERLEYHPEGNAYKHLLLCFMRVFSQFDTYGSLLEKEMDKHGMALVNFGLLCHDLGKNLTKECWPAHHGHEILGLDLVDELCDRLKVPNEYREFGKLACKHHMKFYKFLDMHVKKQYDMVKEITNFKSWEPMQYLIKLHACDLLGRDGKVSEKRVTTYWEVLNRIQKIYSIMEGVTLKDLPEETQMKLFKHKGKNLVSYTEMQ